ncbi:hypothetical protein ACQ86N_10535 [Puia sp. P3]|uniref:hypothetical protein n=1 Tax=Puia sp. P3 TaxID=3423952 RepID=UPI003D67AA91
MLPKDLLFYNGTGGFTTDGKEYKIVTGKNRTTPAPWVNVIANRDMGTVISESGSAYTWCINAHEYRLTPWSNDPVTDAGGEAFYLRDEESGHFWSPTPFPVGSASPYIATHGFGYSSFQHDEQGISTEMFVFVDSNLPVKLDAVKNKKSVGPSTQALRHRLPGNYPWRRRKQNGHAYCIRTGYRKRSAAFYE